MLSYIDAHCHILSDEQITIAVSCGVGRFIMNTTQPDDWTAIVDKTEHNDCVYGAVGVHPWYVANLRDDWDNKLVEMLCANSSLMVGEIGLDKNRADMEKQVAVFRRSLKIAHDYERVAHIHCVGAWGKMMDVLRGSDLPPAMVFHCFSGVPELVGELVKMGAYFSFGVGICNEKHKIMRAVAALVPENRILVESDAPDMAMPDTIPNTVADIAHIRGVPEKDMAETIYNNTMGLLNGGQI